MSADQVIITWLLYRRPRNLTKAGTEIAERMLRMLSAEKAGTRKTSKHSRRWLSCGPAWTNARQNTLPGGVAPHLSTGPRVNLNVPSDVERFDGADDATGIGDRVGIGEVELGNMREPPLENDHHLHSGKMREPLPTVECRRLARPSSNFSGSSFVDSSIDMTIIGAMTISPDFG